MHNNVVPVDYGKKYAQADVYTAVLDNGIYSTVFI